MGRVWFKCVLCAVKFGFLLLMVDCFVLFGGARSVLWDISVVDSSTKVVVLFIALNSGMLVGVFLSSGACSFSFTLRLGELFLAPSLELGTGVSVGGLGMFLRLAFKSLVGSIAIVDLYLFVSSLVNENVFMVCFGDGVFRCLFLFIAGRFVEFSLTCASRR